MQLANGFMMSSALYVVTSLNIPDLLAQGSRPVSELARSTGANEDALYRVLRALASVEFFVESAGRRFELTAVSEAMRSDQPGSVKEMVLWVCNRFHFQVWGELPYSVKTGKPAVEKVFGTPAFEAIAAQPEVAHAFNAAMTCLSRQLAPAVLEAYDFSGIDTLMDVAGGHGFILCEILTQYPKLKGILFDMPSVVEDPRCAHCLLNVNHRCRTVAGDFFEHIPSGADAYYMQHIIHDWDDEPALRILGNCRQALQGQKNGKLLVVDSVIPENSGPHFGKWLDLEMLLMPGGRERAENQFRALFARAGFEITRILPTRGAESVIEARLA
ncbi:MAG TPA: methyltransferase [Terriglobales bacterium]|nr:methyltransferase [Terriglobales bacterium]